MPCINEMSKWLTKIKTLGSQVDEGEEEEEAKNPKNKWIKGDDPSAQRHTNYKYLINLVASESGEQQTKKRKRWGRNERIDV